MSRIDRHEGLLPLGIIESASYEDSVPFVQYAGVYVELAIYQLKDINRYAFAKCQKTVR